VNGERHGKYERFNTAGIPEETGNFVHGKKEGRWVWYDKYGKEGVVAEFKEGQMTSMQDNTVKKEQKR
jgi:antitoxin component YwqK of YwqJK toxin-antitoxin module